LKTGTEESIHACMFIATRFTTAKRQKWEMFSNGRMDKQIVYIHTTEYYSTIKMSEVLTCYDIGEHSNHYAKWKKPDTKDHIAWFHLYEISRIDNTIETESRLVIVRAWGEDGKKLRNVLQLKCFRSRNKWWLHNIVNVLNATKLFTL
jgi:hypothetical protein